MLEARYKSPWRKVPSPRAPTVAELYALAGGTPVTLGFALGSGSAAAMTSLAGVVTACRPWGACALAVTRLSRVGGRLHGVLAKSAVNGLPAAAPGAPVVPVSLRNAEAAIPALDTSILIYGNTVPWWPLGESYALAGVWMRRRSWEDTTRRMRFEAGAGTTRIVAVALDEARTIHNAQLNSDFTAGDFLASDWETITTNEPPLIDVTDLRFVGRESLSEGFFFAVDAVNAPPGGGGEDGGGNDGECSLTLTARIVQSLLNSAVAYVVAERRSEETRDVIQAAIVSTGVNHVILLGGRPSCAGYYAAIIRGEIAVPPVDSGGGEEAPPANGIYVKMSIDGVEQWVPAETMACPVE